MLPRRPGHPVWPFLAAALLLAGCDAMDPYKREGTWRPEGANEANLRAMVAVPADLVGGQEDLAGDGRQAASALNRMRKDTVRPLPDSAVANVVPVALGDQTSAPAPAATSQGGN